MGISVQVVWDDTRGGKVEMVVPIDTFRSMAQRADMCTVFYGGQFLPVAILLD